MSLTHVTIRMHVQHFSLGILSVESLQDLASWCQNTMQDASSASPDSLCKVTTMPHTVPAAHPHSKSRRKMRWNASTEFPECLCTISTHVGVFHKYRCQHRWELVTSTDVNPAEADRIAGKEQKPSTSGIPETSMPKQIDAEQHHPIDCIVYESPTNEGSSESCDEPELQELLLVRGSSFLNALKVARTHADRQRTRARADARTPERTHAMLTRTHTDSQVESFDNMRSLIEDEHYSLALSGDAPGPGPAGNDWRSMDSVGVEGSTSRGSHWRGTMRPGHCELLCF